jgi:hypothetical protein
MSPLSKIEEKERKRIQSSTRKKRFSHVREEEACPQPQQGDGIQVPVPGFIIQ